MSCGSTTCNSTKYIETASTPFPGLGWSWEIPMAWLERIALSWEWRYQRRRRRDTRPPLAQFDEYRPDKIGEMRTRVEVEVEYRRLARLYGFLSRRASMTDVTPYRFACGADVAAARATFAGGRR
jgi:hypothetical protein